MVMKKRNNNSELDGDTRVNKRVKLDEQDDNGQGNVDNNKEGSANGKKEVDDVDIKDEYDDNIENRDSSEAKGSNADSNSMKDNELKKSAYKNEQNMGNGNEETTDITRVKSENGQDQKEVLGENVNTNNDDKSNNNTDNNNNDNNTNTNNNNNNTNNEDDGDEDDDEDDDEAEDEKKRTTTFKFDGVSYSFKERPSVIEEKEGKIEFRVVNNDNTKENLMVLTGLKNIFQKQLPKMPREYISRLVYDRSHLSMAVVRKPLTVVGGITYRPFNNREFAEIVFCAISSTEQVRGYGAHLMNHLKDYVRATSPIKYFLTYADNYAIGYFKKQGFTKEISLDKSVWMGYIKDYEGGTLMQCHMLPPILRYLDSAKILLLQRAAVEKKIKQRSKSNIVRPGLQIFKNAKPGHIQLNPLKDIPGLAESGWSEEMDKLAQKPKRGPHYNFMVTLLSEMHNHPSAWPFATPVNKDEVDDYYEVIKEPMDLSTMESKLENDKYESFDQFLYDARLIYKNCRAYNAESTTYCKNATKLEKFMIGKIKDNPDFAHYLD